MADESAEHTSWGYFRLYRSVFSEEDALWSIKEPRSFNEAWIYLLYRARWSSEPGQVLVAGQVAPIYRGEVQISQAQIAAAMNWFAPDGSPDVRKGRRFLELAYRLARIRPTDRRKLGIYKVINYETYNPLPCDFRLQNHAQNDLQSDQHYKNKEERREEHAAPPAARRAASDRIEEPYQPPCPPPPKPKKGGAK